MGAVENRSVVFQGAVGAFSASTAPAASTGPSRIDPLPRRYFAADRPRIDPPPRMMRRLAAPSAARRRRRRRRRAARRRAAAISVQRIRRSRYRISTCPSTLRRPARAARRRVTALPLQLKQPIGIAHDPVLETRARLLQSKHRQPQAARPATWKSSADAGAWRSGDCGPPSTPSRETYSPGRRRRSPCRRSFFTKRSCCVP